MTDVATQDPSAPSPPRVTSAAPPTVPPPARRRVLVATAVGALAGDLIMWSDGPGAAWLIAAVATAGAVGVAARPLRPGAWALLSSVAVLAVWCVVRRSVWVVAPTVVAMHLCLIGAAGLGRTGSFLDRSLPQILLRALDLANDLLLAVPWIAAGRRRTDRTRSVAAWSGVIIALPVVGVLVLLLASADPVFASMIDLGSALPHATRHVAGLVIGGLAVAALARHASVTTERDLGRPARLPTTTGNVVLGAVALVLGVYATGRVAALTGAAERVLTTQGLTWAEYARGGFFELLAVAAIVLAVLLSAAALVEREPGTRERVRVTAGVVVVIETLGIVVDAIARLDGYVEAYGWTMLRLFSTVVAAWLGVVVLVVGVALVRRYDRRRWLTPVLCLLALVAVFAWGAVNPEAVVVADHLDGPQRAAGLDIGYLARDLGDDGIVAIDERWDRLDDAQRAHVTELVCTPRRRAVWFNPNLARSAADRAVDRWCDPD